MNPLLTTAVRVQSALKERGWRSCLIGGLAVARWGEPRATQDVDFSVFVDFGQEREFIASMLDVFAPMFDDSESLAVQCRVLPVEVDGIKADLSIACFPFEEDIINRASEFIYEPGSTVVTASAEDLIVMKAIAGRPMDWKDIAGIAHRQSEILKIDDIVEQARSLAEIASDPAYLATLEAILDRPIEYL